MIALGESIVIIGASLTGLRVLTTGELLAYLLAFLTTVALWWVYFDRSAGYAARAFATSADPGRLARSAFYWAQVPIVAGIIAVAAGGRLVMANPTDQAGLATVSILLGGTALFIAGHAWFKVCWSGITSRGPICSRLRCCCSRCPSPCSCQSWPPAPSRSLP